MTVMKTIHTFSGVRNTPRRVTSHFKLGVNGYTLWAGAMSKGQEKVSGPGRMQRYSKARSCSRVPLQALRSQQLIPGTQRAKPLQLLAEFITTPPCLTTSPLDFPGGSVVKNLPANAGDRLNPWTRKIAHTGERLSPCATTIEPVL